MTDTLMNQGRTAFIESRRTIPLRLSLAELSRTIGEIPG
jgi:hypothetical protein